MYFKGYQWWQVIIGTSGEWHQLHNLNYDLTEICNTLKPKLNGCYFTNEDIFILIQISWLDFPYRSKLQ